MQFKYTVDKNEYSYGDRRFLEKYTILPVLPIPAKAPEFMLDKLKAEAPASSFYRALTTAKTLEEAEQAIDGYVFRIEKAIIKLGWGLFMVKIGKGKTDASRTAKIECWVGEAPLHQADERSKVTSKFYVPASVVEPHNNMKGYGLINHYFLTQKLDEISERSRSHSSYKRIPVAEAICPAEVLDQTKNRMMAQLPTEEAVRAVTEAEQALEIERIKKREEYEGLAEQHRIEAEAKAVRDKIQKAQDAAYRKRQLAALETHTNVTAYWHKWGGTSQKRVKIEHEADGVSIHIAGERAYIVLPSGKEIIVAKKNLRFQPAENLGNSE